MNTKGFSLVEGLLVLLVVGAVGFGGWYVWSQQEADSLETPGSTTSAKTSEQTNNTEPLSEQYVRLTEQFTGSQPGFRLADTAPGLMYTVIVADESGQVLLERNASILFNTVYPLGQTKLDTKLIDNYLDYLADNGIVMDSSRNYADYSFRGPIDNGVEGYVAKLERDNDTCFLHLSADSLSAELEILNDLITSADDRTLSMTGVCLEKPTADDFDFARPFYAAFDEHYPESPNSPTNTNATLLQIGEIQPGDTEGYETVDGGALDTFQVDGIYNTSPGGGRASFYRASEGQWTFFEQLSGHAPGNCDKDFKGTPTPIEAARAFASELCIDASTSKDVTFGEYFEL